MSTQAQPDQSKRDELIQEAKKITSSKNPLHHLLWVIDGIGIYYRTNGQRGHGIEDAKRYALAQVDAHTNQILDEILAEKIVIESAIDDNGEYVDKIIQVVPVEAIKKRKGA